MGVNHRFLVYIRPKAWRADTGQVVSTLRAFAVNSLLYRAFTGPAMTVSASGLSERALRRTAADETIRLESKVDAIRLTPGG